MRGIHATVRKASLVMGVCAEHKHRLYKRNPFDRVIHIIRHFSLFGNLFFIKFTIIYVNFNGSGSPFQKSSAFYVPIHESPKYARIASSIQ